MNLSAVKTNRNTPNGSSHSTTPHPAPALPRPPTPAPQQLQESPHHVSGAGRLGRRDLEAGAEDAGPVGEPTAVPEQHPVAVVQEAGLLRALGDGERVQQLQVVAHVRVPVGGLQVLLQCLWRRRTGSAAVMARV